MKRVVVEEPGGPEQLRLVESATPEPGPGEALIAIAASGVNFIDVYFRTGLYPSDRPVALGSEAAGVVERTGTGVTIVEARRSRRLHDGPRLVRRLRRRAGRPAGAGT